MLLKKFYLIERDEERTIKAVDHLGKQLGIETPYRIEAFDNSNIQGTNPVSLDDCFYRWETGEERVSKI